jgi:hypothetical protein
MNVRGYGRLFLRKYFLSASPVGNPGSKPYDNWVNIDENY